MQLYKLTEACSVASQIQASDIEKLKQNGFATIVCNRPDDEDFGQPSAAEISAECENQGLAFHHLPITNTGISAEMATAFRGIVAESEPERELAETRLKLRPMLDLLTGR